MKTLDSSHRTILENLDTFQRAERCMQEIKDYQWEILREVADELTAKHAPLVQFDLAKGGWLEGNVFPNWEGTNRHLIGLGLEYFDVPSILLPETTDGCRAYVYCHVLSDPKTAAAHSALSQRMRSLPPPAGFVPDPSQKAGYIFVKLLGDLPVKSFCTRSELKNYFKKPLVVLGDWLVATTPTLTSFSEPRARKARASVG